MTEVIDEQTQELTTVDAPPEAEPTEAEAPAAKPEPQTAQVAAPLQREVKLVAVLKPNAGGGFRAQLGVGANDCDPETRVIEVTRLAQVLAELASVYDAATARWEQQQRYPAAPKPAPPPRQPAARQRAPQRPAAGATATPAAAPATTPAAPAPAAPAQPGVKLQRQVGPDGRTRFVRAVPPGQQSLFGDEPAAAPAPTTT